MVILLHVLVALASMVYAGYTFFVPSKNRLRISYALVSLTLGSGTYLVASTHAPMLQSCMAGLVYLAVVLFELVAARTRLVRVAVKSDS